MEIAVLTVLRGKKSQFSQSGAGHKSPLNHKIFRTSIVAFVALFTVAPATASETVTYTYDELGRLVRTSQTGSVNNGVVTDIDYDDAGNRTQYTVSGSPNGSINPNAGKKIIVLPINGFLVLPIGNMQDSGATGAPGSGGGGTPPSFAVSDASAEEGQSLSFTITKTGTTTQTYWLNWTTADDSAENGSDYTGNSGTLSFTAAETSKTIVIPTIDNVFYEQPEKFYFNLTAASSGATISGGQGMGTITDDEAPNTTPVANPDYFAVSCSAMHYPVLSNDTDADGDTLTLTGVSGPLTPYFSGNYVHVSGTTNPGTYQINYGIRDSKGATASALLTLTWVTSETCPGGGGGPEQ
ncbi:hypothetical protein GCM10009096_15750 [Parasphingorhabdus litoris]|uniref:Calx-beta domain-containing protein n=1 Tax=Parasphingorhabdus litoris TaxID=394733 RepID=A0ABN1AF58_9SPHN|nr:Calx-beta domain-containing protein [Parasphingorhabdus litoris]